MQARWALTGVLALALAAGGRSFVTKAASPTVAVEDLGPTASPTYARGVSPSGRAVGFGYDAGPSGFGFEQSVAPAFVPLPAGASELFAYAINGAEVVTGSYRGADGISRAFRYSAMSADWDDVPLLNGATAATAQGINSSGVVVGFSFTASGTRAFRQLPGQPTEDLGDFGGGYAAAFGINTAGVIVGESRDDLWRFAPSATTAGCMPCRRSPDRSHEPRRSMTRGSSSATHPRRRGRCMRRAGGRTRWSTTSVPLAGRTARHSASMRPETSLVAPTLDRPSRMRSCSGTTR